MQYMEVNDFRAPGKDPSLPTGEQIVCTREPVWTQTGATRNQTLVAFTDRAA